LIRSVQQPSAARLFILVLSSAVAWSTAGFFARVAPVDIWVVLFWRSAFGGLSIVALAINFGAMPDCTAFPDVRKAAIRLRLRIYEFTD